VATRKYEQRFRAEAAQQTRQDILDAVYERLRLAPAKPVSVEQVAQRAGVARSTVYVIFGSRAGLFDAFTEDLWWRRAGFQQVSDAISHPDARENLRSGLGLQARVYAAHRDVFRALFSMAELDSDAVGGAIARLEERRADGMVYLARRLAEQDVLRSDVTVEEAAHVLWLMAGFDSFDAFYTGRKLDVDDVARLLIATAERTLCR
jgi:AcrR family transcriptional regulator